jgi:hypothetical protein
MAEGNSTRRGPRFIDLAGQTFGKWTVVGEAVGYKPPATHWDCTCECGNKSKVSGKQLRSGKSNGCKYCGPKRHGRSQTTEYRVFHDMHNRCTNPSIAAYKDYGGRGITVCDEWESFESFYRDMGPRPSPRYTIDRINNSLGYSKENCRWATKQEQARNTRSCHLLTFNGETRCLSDWAAHFNISPTTITGRLQKGWSVSDALTAPVKTNNYIEFRGTIQTLSQWARQLGISRAALRWRLKHWDTEKALS